MLKLAKYLKSSIGWILLMVCLLFLQAYCDLALPGYTSDIVNVGIQQGGIEDAVPQTIRTEEYQNLFLFLDEEDADFVNSYYSEEDGMMTLKKIDSDTREKLNQILGRPELALTTLRSDSDETKAIKAQMNLPEDADLISGLSQLPQEQLNGMLSEMNKQFDQMPDSIITQASVAFVKAEYQAQGKDLDQIQTRYLLLSGGKMLLMALLVMAAAVSVTFISCRVGAAFSRDLRGKVYEKVLSFSNAEFEKFSTASLITRSTNDIQQIQLMTMMIFRIVLYAPILGIGGFLKVLNTNTSMAWIIGVAVALIMAVVVVLMVVAMPKFKSLQVLIDKLNLVTREILTGIPVIRAFSTQKHEEERFEEANHNLMKTNLFVNRCMTFMMPVMMLIMNGISVLTVYKGAYGIDSGQMQVGDLMAFIQYTMQIIMSFLMICMMSVMLPRASVSGVRVNEVLETEVSIRDPKEPKQAIPGESGTVIFKDVSFRYPDAEENVLSHISFTAKRGETTAIIGSTGSGKSTLVNLIPRFFDVTEGEVLLDGINIKDMTQHELHEKIGYVPQKGVLFSGTIRTNIAYGNEEMPQNEVEKAARIAQAYDFITEKEDGFDSPISQGGTNVSGGQKQRLSIARAVAKKPEVYIFDDSFSALDYKTDVTLRRALKQETKDATTIIVAQRISTILHAEQIIVLDEGKVAGIGNHQQLLKSCEIYHQIASSQLSKEELGDE